MVRLRKKEEPKIKPPLKAHERRDRIDGMIASLANRFPHHGERQDVRAYLGHAYGKSDETLKRQVGFYRGSMPNHVARGRALVHRAVASGLITKAEMLAWLRRED